MAETSQGTLLCQKCGNIAKLNVIVSNPGVNGRWVRTSCSRLCGSMLVRDGIDELERTGGWRHRSTFEMVPLLTEKDAGVVVR